MNQQLSDVSLLSAGVRVSPIRAQMFLKGMIVHFTWAMWASCWSYWTVYHCTDVWMCHQCVRLKRVVTCPLTLRNKQSALLSFLCRQNSHTILTICQYDLKRIVHPKMKARSLSSHHGLEGEIGEAESPQHAFEILGVKKKVAASTKVPFGPVVSSKLQQSNVNLKHFHTFFFSVNTICWPWAALGFMFTWDLKFAAQGSWGGFWLITHKCMCGRSTG